MKEQEQQAEQRFLTEAEVASMLRVTVSTVSRMVKAGEIPYLLLRAGNRKKCVRFDRERLEGWIQRQSRGPGAGRRGLRIVPALVDTMATRLEASPENSANLLNCNGAEVERHRFNKPASDIEAG